MTQEQLQFKERLNRLKVSLRLANKTLLADKLGVSRATLGRYEASPDSVPAGFMSILAQLEKGGEPNDSADSRQTTGTSGSVREEMIPYGQRLPYTPEVDVTRGLASFLLEQLGRSEAFALASELVKQAEQGDSSAGKKARLILELLEE